MLKIGEIKKLIDIKIEKAEICRRSKEEDLEGFEISYRIDNSKAWNTIDLTKAETSKFALELIKAVLEDV